MNPRITTTKALSNLAEYILKQEDAPCSAQSHLDHAILILSEMSLGWHPSDPEITKVIRDARWHMEHYFDIAKEPWPREPTCLP